MLFFFFFFIFNKNACFFFYIELILFIFRAPSDLVINGITKFVSFRRKQTYKETNSFVDNIKMLAFFNEENAPTGINLE